MRYLDISRPLTRLDQHATAKHLSKVLQALEEGNTVALTTDAGTPVISDPGAQLIDMAYTHGIPVDAIPGPSAVTNAVALAGFFAQQFAFLGFLPRKSAAAQAQLEIFRKSTMTLVLFEAAQRLPKTLVAAKEALGDRRAAICREMTKLHQEVFRDRLSSLAHLAPKLKGEITLVIEGYRRILDT